MASDFRLGTPRAKTAFPVHAGRASPAATWAPARSCRASSARDAPRSCCSPAARCPRDEALAWGFFNRLVAPDDVLTESLQLAAEIAHGPTFAHAMTKKMLHAEWNMSVDAAIDAEAEAQAMCMQTEDFRRAYRAFAAKQKPQFEGN